ncbi:hypothetical protein [Kaistella jeonii]|uniref:Uncharacterized protein n=1 Tax=Kaistella jeonii TaxID=266749 RepID=A0A0C1FKX0_9FLAO|nr:hypothetical protein [Kaistella jeonii]KIA88579.1 hypothetical protein OA86_11215 [Kaistella jeonii]SFC21479.1 hypothetical protein SAMN05421876_10996 [Kaistella jeonii]VEI96943.1 Uncharacterised protein [Kaistella jeonii]
MKKLTVTRNYNLADAVLKQKADEFINLLDRDTVEFTERGYNAAAKTNFENARDSVDTFPTDETLEALKMELTANKDAARSALEKSMRTIFNMASNHFGSQSAQYRAFGEADISRKPDAELARTYKVMVTAANQYLAVLGDEGLSQAMIDNLTAQGIVLDDSIDAMAKGITDRDISTESRIETLNALYGLLTKYAGIGQDIFYEINEAKYNDYVIYDTPSGMPAEVPVI